MSEAASQPLRHDSIRPSRGGMPGETAFLTAWQDLMSKAGGGERDPLLEVHSGRWDARPEPDQADATMAATLVQWLGTNAGACLIHQARALQADGMFAPDAYRAAWAIRNARKRGINSGLRSIEILMVPPDAELGIDQTPYAAPSVTLRQYETAEHVATWLGTESGQAFVEAREREMEAFREHEQVRHREANRTGTAPPRGLSAQGVADYFRVLRKAVSAQAGQRAA